MTLISGKGRLVAGLTGGPQEEEVPVASYPIIECQGVTKSFGAACAVKEVSLALEPGEIVALVGPTGSGKTTLLRMMAGFEAPDSGTVSVEGRLVAGPDSWVPPEGRRLGMVFQDYALFPHMTVIQNVAFGLQGWSTQDKEQRVLESLELVRLPSDLAERYPYQLSGGEQQRVALARSLAPRPIAILLDEPFSNVDHQMRMQLRAEVKNLLRSTGLTAVHITHTQEEALFMGDRVAVMNSGILEQVDIPEDIYHRPSSRFVAQFLGIANFIPARATEDGIVTEIGVLHSSVRLPPGAEIEVVLHPDNVAIRPSDAGQARVVSRAFRGLDYVYVLSLASGTMVRSQRRHTECYKQGDSVDVSLEPDRTLTCFVNGDSAPGLETGPSFLASTGEAPPEGI